MRILVFSDTHGNIRGALEVLKAVNKVDMVLHAGDNVTDAQALSYVFDKIPFHYVRGNNDYFSDAENDKVVIAGDKTIFLTHGHYYNVKSTLRRLSARAAVAGADLAVFGHTHKGFDGYVEGAHIFNPGAMGFGEMSYGVIEIEEDKLKTAVIMFNKE